MQVGWVVESPKNEVRHVRSFRNRRAVDSAQAYACLGSLTPKIHTLSAALLFYTQHVLFSLHKSP